MYCFQIIAQAFDLAKQGFNNFTYESLNINLLDKYLIISSTMVSHELC